jgi:hypothetical protein
MNVSVSTVPITFADKVPLSPGSSACRYWVPMMAVIGTIAMQEIA